MSETKNLPANRTPVDEASALIQRMAPALQKALPKHLNADRMARIVTTAVRMKPELALCTTMSFVGSILTAAQLGLELNTPLGHAWLVPYKNECQLLLGYQGMIELARRSGFVTNIYAYVVREGDHFRYRLGLSPDVDHVPSDDADREAKPITHVYAVAHFREGPPAFIVLSKAQVHARKARSKVRANGPWDTDEEAMTLKTAVRALWRWLPKSAEMQRVEAIEQVDEYSDSQTQAWDPELAKLMETPAGEGSEPTLPPAEVSKTSAPKKGNEGVKEKLKSLDTMEIKSEQLPEEQWSREASE